MVDWLKVARFALEEQKKQVGSRYCFSAALTIVTLLDEPQPDRINATMRPGCREEMKMKAMSKGTWGMVKTWVLGR